MLDYRCRRILRRGIHVKKTWIIKCLHNLAKVAPVHIPSRRSMPTAVHAYLFYPGRRQNSPAFKVIVEALKI